MVMCAFLGITNEILQSPAPYTRILGFNDMGKIILKGAKENAALLHTGEKADDQYWHFEQKWNDLYGLFAAAPTSAGAEPNRRVYIHK
jgi:hypothetical protein